MGSFGEAVFIKMNNSENIPIHYVIMTRYDEVKNCVLIELAVSDLELA